MRLPFRENIEDGYYIREFKESTDSDELVWHRDREDRIIEALEDTDWMFQFDNQLPQKLEGKIFIPKETYHRVIKGSGDLKIRLKKL